MEAWRLVVWCLRLCGVLLSWGVRTGTANLALSFPPPRRFDLDFLDNHHTRGPCGMPKGPIRTTILSGRPFNVTWRLAYPQKGGFRLQVLDSLHRPRLDLTPVTAQSKFVSLDPTAQQYPVEIPADFECDDCTIRLMREGNEWSSDYWFWSCADVDIKPREKYNEDCSMNGRYLLRKCRCNRLYYGSRCQYREECQENLDCGEMGRCVELNPNATIPPQRQCYCEMGWFGPSCKKRSLLKTMDVDLSSHRHRKFSPDFQLYWRVLVEEGELEVVLKVNGTNYVGIGWRPTSLTPSCKNFPLLRDPTQSSIAVNSASPLNGSSIPNNAETNTTKQTKSYTELNKHDMAKEQNQAFELPMTKDREPRNEPRREITVTTSSGRIPTSLLTEFNATIQSLRPLHTVTSRETKEYMSVETKPEVSVQTTVTYRISSSQEAPLRQRRDTQEKGVDSSPYILPNDLSPMDCTDMVIGMARGTSFRIWDYYTRDRSTPRLDTYWGGKNDLTAAMGFEKNGVTTIMFRKKLKATESTDHSIENSLMQVIWAKGQEFGKYIHMPGSGLETPTDSVNDFYKPDELKYHGHGDQRGSAVLNFFEQAPVLGSDSGKSDSSFSINCRGQWVYPSDCNISKDKCEYLAKWQYNSRTDNIHFVISTTNINLWTGIAFSNNQKMAQTDAIIGWVDKSGRPFIMDTWIVGQTAPLIDPIPNIFNVSGSTNEGVTTLTFTRKRNTGDDRDLEFTDDKCLYMIFPVKGGEHHPVSRKISQHQNVRISSTRICIKSCNEDEEPVTPAPVYTNYNAEVRLLNFEKKLGSDHFELLKNSIIPPLKRALTKVTGFHNIDVKEFRQEKDNVIAKLRLEVDNIKDKKKQSPEEIEQTYKKIFEDFIATGRVGSLSIDPGYLIFESIQTTMKIEETESEHKTTLLSITKLWIVIGCIIALVIVAVMQAGCTLCKANSSNGPVHKDNLIQNSAWKDYSAANSNYAFEAFESEEKQPSSVGPTNGSSPSARPNPHSINTHPMLNYQGNGNRYADTQSLQRPKGYSQPPERSTYSLPRTQPQPPLSYYTHRPQRNSSDQLQPDFYFMPSQRKYSGEVVRVYVDYNNPHK